MIELANGVDLEVFRPVGKCGIEVLARFGVPPNTSAVLFVGAMDRAHFFKGVPVLIEALRSLPRVHALFVGEGNLRSRYAEQAKSLLGLRAHFVGSLQLDELVALYQQSSLTVLPSTTQGEAFGMVLLESLACGTPVVASDLPGVRTVVEHGGDGYLAPAGDPDALAEAIGYLCANPARSAAMGVSGRRKVEKFYAWSALGANLEAVYGDVLMLAATSSAHRARPTAGSACSPK